MIIKYQKLRKVNIYTKGEKGGHRRPASLGMDPLKRCGRMEKTTLGNI